MLEVYRTFMDDVMALGVVTGEKTPDERFAGALRTYACEALMRDGKALQAGTSHHLGQNFARAFDVQFQTEQGEHDYVWSTSWGVSTRLIGGLIMTHGDDQGLVLPPRLAPIHAVVVPIWKSDEERTGVLEAAQQLAAGLEAAGLRARLDDRDTLNPGAKFYEWERKGVPVRLELGPRDLAAGQVMLVRRFVGEGVARKQALPLGEGPAVVSALMEEIQAGMLADARARREARSRRGFESFEEFCEWLDASPGFGYAGWCGEKACSELAKDRAKATIRVIPDEEFRSQTPPETCLVCGSASWREVLWARAY